MSSASLLSRWWNALVHPDEAVALVLEGPDSQQFARFLAMAVAALYGVYGLTMGGFRGWFPALVSGLKLPFLFLLTTAICIAPLYVLNCGLGPGLRWKESLRLLLLASSANAAALASYAPVSLFLTLTSPKSSYQFITMLHVVAFAVAGIASVAVVALVLRAVARAAGRPLRLPFVIGWGLLYGLVGSHLSWVLRPWIGAWEVPYEPFRPLSGSFFDSVITMLFHLLQT